MQDVKSLAKSYSFKGSWSGDRDMVGLAGGVRDGDFEHLGRLRALRSLDSGGDELLAWGP